MLANSAWPGYFMAAGLASAAYVIIPGLLIEAAALFAACRRRDTGQPLSVWRALIFATAANLVSTLVGMAPLLLVPLDLGPTMLLHFTVTTTVELLFYRALVRRKGAGLVGAVIVGNVLSYFLLLVAFRFGLTW